jgi:ABC-type transport system involved in multi-copper enzyme maturation permease subunit
MLFSYLQSNAPGQMAERLGSFGGLLSGVYNAWSGHFLLALLVGTGAIAADNRANALQVYLAKPITKRDYLIGKWAYVFLILFFAYLAPMLLATLFAAFSAGWGEFLKDQPLLFPKLLLLGAIPAATHASAIIGISAWNKTPWLVGVIYAGVVIFSGLLAQIVALTLEDSASQTVQQTISLFSIDGAITGVGRCIIGETPRFFGGGEFMAPALPNPWPLLFILASVWVLGILAARLRIRAVEVVQG